MSDTPIAFNEYATDLNKTTLELIEQVLLKHSRAVLDGMHSHIVHRNNRITALERELTSLKAENEALRKDKERLDWLERQVVIVLGPLRCGVREGFTSSPDLEEEISTLRSDIDAARKESHGT